MKYQYASAYIKALANVTKKLEHDFYIRHISYNSKDIKRNSLFVVKGNDFKIQYLYEAIKKGARFIVLDTNYIKKEKLLTNKKFTTYFNDEKIIFLIVDDIREAMLKIVDLYYNMAYKKLNLIGITGTKGKTTTAYYLYNVLKANKIKAGLITSIKTNNGKKETDALLTTPEIFELHKFFYECVKNKLKYVIMEVSSQALKYKRIKGLNFFASAFLNISNDHISEIEHPNMKDYLISKLKLATLSKNFLINKNVVSPKLTMVNNVINAFEIRSILRYAKIKYKTFKVTRELKFSLKGFSNFNLENACAAISISKLIIPNITETSIYDAITTTKIEGRTEIINHKDKIIIVDYAHNGASFNAILNYAKTFNKKELVLLFGATGTKGKNRRVDIANEVALCNPTKIYLTEDDPGFESPEKIAKSICELYSKVNQALKKKTIFINDRAKAIKTAIKDSKDDSIIMILGKGNDCFMVRNGKKMKYDGDPQIVKAYLKEVESKKKNLSRKKISKKKTK